MFGHLMQYTKKYRKYLFLGALFVALETVFELIIPMLMADIIDVGVVNGDKDFILRRGALMLGCAIVSLILGTICSRLIAVAGQGFGAEIRKAMFAKIQDYSFSNIDSFSTSSLVTRVTSDVMQVQNAITGGLRAMVRAPAMLIMGLFFSFSLNKDLAMVFVVAIPVLAIILFTLVSKIRVKFLGIQTAVEGINHMIEENLTNIRVVKTFVRGEYEVEKFDDVNENLRTKTESAFHLAQLNSPSFQIVMYAASCTILWYGGNLIFKQQLMVGQLTSFMSYILQIMNSLMMISNVFLILSRAVTSGERIMEVFDEPSDMLDGGDLALEVTKGDIVFDNVSFKYKEDAEEYVLKDINLSFKSGETIGIIGGTGSAKSTLVQLIPRLYDASAGEVIVDGHNVKDYSMNHLRDAIGVVLQKNTLFSGTVKENLLWGNPNASDEEINWALQVSSSDEFIDRLKNGIETDLGQGGVNVSGGQKQRLCIARALLKRPKVIIFDDSTSAVDTATEKSIRDGLASLGDVTKIIIAQRISSVEHADQIVVLEDGEINQVGSHLDLIESNEIYKEIYESQKEGVGLDG